jgi:C1A family cysteine protease
MKLICTMILVMTVTMIQVAYADELQEIQEAIKIKKVRWVAGRTSVSELSDVLKRSRLGVLLPDEKGDAPRYIPGNGALPLHFDWRDAGVVSPVKDQGNCGSCWAFSTVAALESIAMMQSGITNPPPDYSEQFLVSYNMLNQGCDGGYMNVVSNFLKRVGVPSEDCLPYREEDKISPFPCSDWKSEVTHLVTWSWVDPDVESLKAAVYENPITTTYLVYKDFYYYESGVYEHVWGKKEGGHAVLIVGWDNTEECFIVKNSWGGDWGENGYFKIAYSQVSNEVEFGGSTVDFDGVQ